MSKLLPWIYTTDEVAKELTEALTMEIILTSTKPIIPSKYIETARKQAQDKIKKLSGDQLFAVKRRIVTSMLYHRYYEPENITTAIRRAKNDEPLKELHTMFYGDAIERTP